MPFGTDTHSAFLSESVFVTTAKDSKDKDLSTDLKASGTKKEKSKNRHQVR